MNKANTTMTMTMTRRLFILSAVLLSAGTVQAAQSWPDNKPITWVVPYPPGGSTDVLARSIAQELDQKLDTRVIVENRPGATGTIGAARVARAEPNGLTLLGTSIGPQAIAPHMMGKLPYDPISSFKPVITIGTIPHILVVGSKQPYRSVEELIDAAKAQPGKLAYASGGTGTILQMQGELLQMKTGASFIHVPYKGDSPALQDTLGQQVQFMFAPVAAALPHIESGSLRALAVTSADRLKSLPDVPTMKQEGFDDFVVEQWQAVFAPADTPENTVKKINSEISAALNASAVKTLAEKLGITLTGGSPQDLDQIRKSDYDKWGEVIEQANIKN